VIERRQHLRLALKTCDAIWMRGNKCGQDLDGDVAFELAIWATISYGPRRVPGVSVMSTGSG
jgi:L-aminopeptidase/D-esterase-like protein